MRKAYFGGLRKKSSDDDGNCQIDLKSNTIYLCGDINQKMASTFRRYLRKLEKNNRNIVVEINSPGGDIEAGFIIIDSIQGSKRKITTRVAGQCCSMASVILLAGRVREATPTSTIMIHHGSATVSGTFTELKNEMDEVYRLENLTWDYMDDKTGKKRGYWKEKCGPKNLYLTAEMAIKEGLVHRKC